jgi:hypothetical protein
MGRGNAICPDTSSRSHSTAVESQNPGTAYHRYSPPGHQAQYFRDARPSSWAVLVSGESPMITRASSRRWGPGSSRQHAERKGPQSGRGYPLSGTRETWVALRPRQKFASNVKCLGSSQNLGPGSSPGLAVDRHRSRRPSRTPGDPPSPKRRSPAPERSFKVTRSFVPIGLMDPNRRGESDLPFSGLPTIAQEVLPARPIRRSHGPKRSPEVVRSRKKGMVCDRVWRGALGGDYRDPHRGRRL